MLEALRVDRGQTVMHNPKLYGSGDVVDVVVTRLYNRVEFGLKGTHR